MTEHLPALYQVTDEFLAAYAQLQDMELDEQTVADTLEAIKFPLEKKAEAVAAMARNMESFAAQIKIAETQMAMRRSAIEARAKRLRTYLQQNLERAGVHKIESPWFTLSMKKNPPAVEVFDPELVPDSYKRIPPVPMPEVDKGLIKDALKAGKEVPGCKLTQSLRLEIK